MRVTTAVICPSLLCELDRIGSAGNCERCHSKSLAPPVAASEGRRRSAEPTLIQRCAESVDSPIRECRFYVLGTYLLSQPFQDRLDPMRLSSPDKLDDHALTDLPAPNRPG